SGVTSQVVAVHLFGGPIPLAYAVQAAAILAAAMLVFIVWWRKLSLPLRAAALAAATLIAVPVAIFYDLMLGTIAVCWLVRDKERPITATETTFFAAITLMLLDARHLGESWHIPTAAVAVLGLFTIVATRAFRELAQQDPAWALTRWWGKRYAT